MQERKQYFINAERGISLTGLIFVLFVLGVAAVFAMRIVPSYTEYRTIQAAIVKAKDGGGTPAEMRTSFDKSADINNITAITSHDLVITRDSGEPQISFAYEKRLPLFGNASLLLEYAGTTDKSGVVAAQTAASAAQ
jgi:hypothetical protein